MAACRPTRELKSCATSKTVSLAMQKPRKAAEFIEGNLSKAALLRVTSSFNNNLTSGKVTSSPFVPPKLSQLGRVSLHVLEDLLYRFDWEGHLLGSGHLPITFQFDASITMLFNLIESLTFL